MKNEIAKTKSNLPASVVAMQKGLANSVAEVGAGIGGEQFMKMNRQGEFLFGAEGLEVEEDSTWAVNPTQFTHGWICWGDKEKGTGGKVLGEAMALASGPLPTEPPFIETGGPWTKQVGIQLRCLDGEDEGIQCLFKTNSLGGRRAYTALVSEVVAEVNEESEFVVPVVKLVSGHYNHKDYGKTFTPSFEIVDWMSMEGLADSEVAEEEPEPEPEPKRTRAKRTPTKKKAAAKKAKAEKSEEIEEPEEEKAPRRRRRRG